MANYTVADIKALREQTGSGMLDVKNALHEADGDQARAAEILRRSVPEANDALITSATDFIGRVRALDLDKAPGMAETIDWVSALTILGAADLVRPEVIRTLSAIAKTPDDRTAITGAFGDLLRAELSPPAESERTS